MRAKAEYIWIDGQGELRSKSRSLERDDGTFPLWSFDGSSTGQAEGSNSDVILKPVYACHDPLSKDITGYLVMCETYLPSNEPAKNNHRFPTPEISGGEVHVAWFSFEQEYVIYDPVTCKPLGWTDDMAPQGGYYCGVGVSKAFGRRIAEKHYHACLKAGLQISGINAEVMPSQWEFQIGPCDGLIAGDQLWLARYLLLRIAEREGLGISFDPKPENDKNGSGLHTNFSTLQSRGIGGLQILKRYIQVLEKKHQEHIGVYGDGNARRLTGNCETSSIDRFSWGIADRNASIRIPRHVAEDGYGYLEDRRPSANADPYLVIKRILKTLFYDTS